MYTTEKCLPYIGTYPSRERRPLSISSTNSYCTCILSYPIYLYVYSVMIIIILYYCSQNERDVCQNSSPVLHSHRRPIPLHNHSATIAAGQRNILPATRIRPPTEPCSLQFCIQISLRVK